MQPLNLNEIRTDGDTQPRVALNEVAVANYMEAVKLNADFPPIIGFRDGVNNHWLADGYHRVEAYRRLGIRRMRAEVREGTLEDAKIYAAAANFKHGLQRTAGDKRRAVEMVLSTEVGKTWTQERIAEHVHCSQQFVSRIIEELQLRDNNSSNSAKFRTPSETPEITVKQDVVAKALAANPTASNRQIAKSLGVNDKTVGAVRKRQAKPTKAETKPKAPKPKVVEPVVTVEPTAEVDDDDLPGVYRPTAEEPPKYSCAAARDIAAAAMSMSRSDRLLLRSEIDGSLTDPS